LEWPNYSSPIFGRAVPLSQIVANYALVEMKNIERAIVEHGLGTQFSELSPEALKSVKTFLLDSIGVGIAGAKHPLVRKLLKVTQGWSANGKAHVWGQNGLKFAAGGAAFLNGFQLHCQEFDCVHEPAVLHPMATILAALSAEVESSKNTISGQDLAIAIAVSVDLATCLGDAVPTPLKFFRPATAGIFGATLGIARLRGFSTATTQNALGYALAFCSGSMQAHVEGKPTLPIQVANASRNAIFACNIAEAGLEGPVESLSGPFGYIKLMENDFDVSRFYSKFGKEWQITRVSHKPYPTGRACQGGIRLIQNFLQANPDLTRIESVDLSAPPLINRLVGRPFKTDMTTSYARLCFQYCGAVTLLKGNIGLEDFSPEALHSPQIAALANKISLNLNAVEDPSAFSPQRLSIKFKDGQTVNHETSSIYGSPEDPMTDDENISKFRKCIEFASKGQLSGQESEIIRYVSHLEVQKDVKDLFSLTSASI